MSADLDKLNEAFKIADGNFDREDKALVKLRDRLACLPLDVTADQYICLQAEIELQGRRVAECTRLKQEAGSRLDNAFGQEAARSQREADQQKLDALRKELDAGTVALAEKRELCFKLQREIPDDVCRLQKLMAEIGQLAHRAQPAQSQPSWYDSRN
jgi:hypothetical protein